MQTQVSNFTNEISNTIDPFANTFETLGTSFNPFGDDHNNPVNPNPLLTQALKYAGDGLKVFPLHYPVGNGCSCGKTDCHSPAKHPMTYSGLKEATTDQSQVTEWWTQNPKANIGIVTGQNNFYVLDIDIGENKKGDESLERLIKEYGRLPKTLIATTGSGGKHYCFKYSGDEKLKNRTAIREGIDFRGNGGYIVAAPSLHKSGRNYSWDNENPLAEMPQWLVDLVAKKDTPSVKNKSDFAGQNSLISGNQGKIHNLSAYSGKQGDRNDTLFKLGSSMREKYGFDGTQLLECLKGLNNSFTDPLGESEVEKIANGICSNYSAGNQVEHSNDSIPEFNGADYLDNLFETYKQRERGKLLGWPLKKFKQLAQNIDGVQPGFYLIPGEAGAGKTMFLINFFLDVIQSNESVSGYYISLDDPKNIIVNRCLACLSGVSINNVQKLKGFVSDEKKVLKAKNDLKDLFSKNRMNLFDIGGVQHINQLKALAEKASLEKKKFFIAIDGVYNLGVGNHGGARDENIKRANQLKELSDVYNIPLICTAEVRKSEGGAKGARVLSNNDIMESGKYIYNANIIWMLSREFDNQSSFTGQLRLSYTKNKMSSFNENQILNLDKDVCLLGEEKPKFSI